MWLTKVPDSGSIWNCVVLEWEQQTPPTSLTTSSVSAEGSPSNKVFLETSALGRVSEDVLEPETLQGF